MVATEHQDRARLMLVYQGADCALALVCDLRLTSIQDTPAAQHSTSTRVAR